MQVTISRNAEELEALREQARAHGGLSIPLSPEDDEPELFAPIELELLVNERPWVTVQGQIVQVFDGGLIAIMLDTDGRQTLERARPAASKEGRDLNEPVWKQFESLSKPELIRLAQHGNESERRWILKQRDASLHLHLLRNPGTTPREIARAIRAGGVQVNFIQTVLSRSDLTSNATIAEALVTNPLTPPTQIPRLMARVSFEAVKRLAKSTDQRQVVVGAARKRVMNGR
jgi:hypothetical protein